MRPKWLPDLAVVVSLAGVSALLWPIRVEGPSTSRLSAFGNLDQFSYFHPLYELTGQRWASFTLPLWNQWQLAGLPLAATPQAGAFYPPNLLYALLPTHVAMRGLAFAHVVLAGGLLYALARILGAGRTAAFLGGVAYAWSSFVIGWHLWPPCLGVLGWLPMPLIGITWIRHGRFGRGCACLAIGLAAQLLCGHMPLALFGFQAAAGYALLAVVPSLRARELHAALVTCAWIAAGFALAALLAAIQWLPSLELSQLATRNPGGLTRMQIEPYGSLPLEEWYRRLQPAAAETAYAGALVILLAPLAFAMRRHRADAWIFAGLGLAFTIVALGSATPLFDLYLLVPGSAMFRGPQRALCVVVLAVCVLAALGADALLSRLEESRRLDARTRVALALALSLAAAVALWARAPIWAIGAGVIVIGLCALAPARVRPFASLALVAVALADLARVPPNVERQVWHRESRAVFDDLASEFRALGRQLGLARVVVPWDAKHRVPTYARGPTRHGVYVFSDYEPLSLRRYADYASFIQNGRPYDPGAPDSEYSGDFNFRRPLVHKRLLAAAGVRGIVRVRSTSAGRPFLALEEIAGALPRAYVVHGVRAAGSAAETLGSIASGALEIDRQVALERPPSAALAEPAGTAASGEGARVRNYESSRVVIDATLTRPGALVLLDVDFPGWQARIDGKRARIYNANYLFRAVWLPAGKHRVEFVYTPASVHWGIALSALGVALWFALVAVRVRRHRAARRSAPALDVTDTAQCA